MLPTPAAQENLAWLLRSKLLGEVRKCIFGSTYNNIKEWIEKFKREYAPAKSVYQLQGELGNTFMWETENDLFHMLLELKKLLTDLRMLTDLIMTVV